MGIRWVKIRGNQKKKGYSIYEIFYKNLMVTTKQKSKAETQNIKKNNKGNREEKKK